MEQKVRDFVEQQYKSAEKFANTPQEVIDSRAVAFGALHFAANNCFDTYNKDLETWWNNVMLDAFNELARRKR